jgi:carboxypeptidase C (cathepsin A)
VDFIKNNKDALGVPKDLDYLPGSDQVYESFHADIAQSYASDVVIMLRHIRVLIYNGQDDFVVNTAGVLQYLNSLGWEGISAWKRAKKQKWTIYGEIRGWAKTSGNLWFVLVNKAGHLVPSDQPWSAANMLGHFISKDNNW